LSTAAPVLRPVKAQHHQLLARRAGERGCAAGSPSIGLTSFEHGRRWVPDVYRIRLFCHAKYRKANRAFLRRGDFTGRKTARRGACSSPRRDPAPGSEADGRLVVDDVHGVQQLPLVALRGVGPRAQAQTPPPWPGITTVFCAAGPCLAVLHVCDAQLPCLKTRWSVDAVPLPVPW